MSNVPLKCYHKTILPLTDLRFCVFQMPLVDCPHNQVITSPTIHPTALPWCRQTRAPVLKWALYIREKRAMGGRQQRWVVNCSSPWERLLDLGGIDQLHRHVTIEILPDDILLRIFDFYLYDANYDRWHTLVHVSRRWRNVVFASPRRLNLQLLCRYRSVREMLDIWPELPIVITYDGVPEMMEGVIAALELNDRVSRIDFWQYSRSSSELERLVAEMQVSFPVLRDLEIWSFDETAPVISDSFLGGSAPRLQYLDLRGIPFPTLPNLLLSATDLIDIRLLNIPHSGYFSPEAMVTCLAALTRLESLFLGFRSPQSRPSRAGRRRPPLTHTILPGLTHLYFKGVTEYLEDLLAQVDVPLLEDIEITFLNQLIFDVLQLPKFICRTTKFTVLDQADVVLEANTIAIGVTLSQEAGIVDPTRFKLEISCRTLDWQLSSLAQVCNPAFSNLSTLERLNIHDNQRSPPHCQDDMENIQWLKLFHPFTTIKNLYLSKEVARHVAPALQELTGQRVTEVLPALQNIYLDGLQLSGPVQKAIGQFVAARQLSGYPVAIHR